LKGNYPHPIMTFIPRHACATLMIKGDFGGDFQSLARDLMIEIMNRQSTIESLGRDEVDGTQYMFEKLMRAHIHGSKKRI